jgi:hypothetical protein
MISPTNMVWSPASKLDLTSHSKHATDPSMRGGLTREAGSVRAEILANLSTSRPLVLPQNSIISAWPSPGNVITNCPVCETSWWVCRPGAMLTATMGGFPDVNMNHPAGMALALPPSSQATTMTTLSGYFILMASSILAFLIRSGLQDPPWGENVFAAGSRGRRPSRLRMASGRDSFKVTRGSCHRGWVGR